MSTIARESTIKRKIQLPFVIVDSFVSLRMSTIARESTITREIHAKVDNGSNNKRFHYYEVHFYQRRSTVIVNEKLDGRNPYSLPSCLLAGPE